MMIFNFDSDSDDDFVQVMKWYADKSLLECSGYSEFITKFRVTDKSAGDSTSNDTVDFENFRWVEHNSDVGIVRVYTNCF